MQLQGKRAVITGGGRGIGAAVAKTLAEAGAAVVVSARSRDQVESVATDLQSAGHRAAGFPCDVTDPEQVTALCSAATEALGGPADILVNNAGIASSAPLAKVTLAKWEQIMAVNVTGTFLCTQAFLPGMLAADWGRVVNVASVAGKVGGAYMTAYAASKHAVMGFTRALAIEVARTNVTVNSVCPGFVDTEMASDSVTRIVAKTGMDAAHAKGQLEAFSPQKRLYTSEEVAYQVLCLCDPRAGGVNGQGVVLDGGAVQS